ncbi:hypothetical protein [Lysobacter hankyongensis]|uniref:hypothetical protein n=1 Tax=Lysobacter hankyongensis TaxID=1176535 RepID=UPI003CD0A59D
MNGRIERVWSTLKQQLRAYDIRNEAELQATSAARHLQPAPTASIDQRAYAG